MSEPGPDQTYTVQNVIERAINLPSFCNALFAVAASRTGGRSAMTD
jgi:hypothetical protein